MNVRFPKELSSLWKHPIAISRPLNQIFLLSHMRAFTSLFGHILGSNPQIEGYYEMHLGYYSWRSLFRQKLIYYRDHDPKPHARYIFDKVLHNDHHVSPELLARASILTIFSLREPGPTICSIVKQYERASPHHQFTDINFATEYYLTRLAFLSKLSESLGGNFVYMDASALTLQSDQTLAKLSRILTLETALSSNYKTMEKTAKGNTGDHSPEIKSGVIQDKPKRKYSPDTFTIPRLNELEDCFAHTRALLRQYAQNEFLMEPEVC